MNINRQTSVEILKLSFGYNTTKIKNYIIDAEVDVVKIKDDYIPADEFCNNIHKYMGEQSSDFIMEPTTIL
jgi:hypothetical protein